MKLNSCARLYFFSTWDIQLWHRVHVQCTWTWDFKTLSQLAKLVKVEKILKGSMDLIPSPSPSVKIQIMCGKVCLKCKGKTLLGVANTLFVFKCFLTSPSNVLPSWNWISKAVTGAYCPDIYTVHSFNGVIWWLN